MGKVPAPVPEKDAAGLAIARSSSQCDPTFSISARQSLTLEADSDHGEVGSRAGFACGSGRAQAVGAQALSSCGAGGPALFRAGGAHPRALRRRARSARMRCGERRACAGSPQIPALRPRVPVPRVRHGCPCAPPAPSEARAPAAAVRRAPRARLRRSCAARAARPPPRRAAPRQDSAAHSDRVACVLQAAVQGRLDRLGEFADRRENDGIFL